MSNWLVIGAGSFTGSHFCQYLEQKGENVYKRKLQDEHTFPIVDYVVNFAALNVVSPSWTYPEKYCDVNVVQTVHLFEKLRQLKTLKRYVHISTPEVYGSTYGRVTETHPYNPSTPYAASRAAAEMLLKCYGNQYGLPYIITRSCNVYGPGQQAYRLIPKLITCISRGIPFPLEGQGHSVRSFLHVRDVCRAIEMVALSGDQGSSYHISSPIAFSISGLVETICGLLGKDPKTVVEHVPERPGKDQNYNLDDTKIRKLGWNDEIFIEDGIKEVIQWMHDNWEIVKEWPTVYSLDQRAR